MTHRTLPLAMLVLFFGLALGCEAKQAAPSPEPPKVETAPQAKADAPSAKAEAAKGTVVAQAPAAAAKKAEPEKTYKVRIVPGEAVAGAEASSIIEVTPLLGYKMNKEFPSKLKMSETDGVTVPKSEYTKADAEITEQILRFKVAFTVAKTGKVNLNGSADFSVCNEKACKLIRDEKLAWEVATR